MHDIKFNNDEMRASYDPIENCICIEKLVEGNWVKFYAGPPTHSKFPVEGSMFNDSRLLEILADIEHARWSRWQSYLHSLCIINLDGSLTIPKDKVEWWEGEINTPYSKLSEEQKESDRKEARITLDAISKFMFDHKQEENGE